MRGTRGTPFRSNGDAADLFRAFRGARGPRGWVGLGVRGTVGIYEQGVVMNKIKLSGVAPRKRETTNMGSARLSGAFFALSNDGSQAMVGVGKPLSHDHLRTEVLFWSKFLVG